MWVYRGACAGRQRTIAIALVIEDLYDARLEGEGSVMKDVIIIGGGMAGLAAGCYAQASGYRSQILEAHAIPGGLCTAWKRKGYVFDTSLHLLMSSTSGTFHRTWCDLGVLQTRTFVYPEVRMRIETQGRQIDLHSDLDQLERELVAASPRDAAHIRTLTGLARQFARVEIDLEKPRELWGPLDYLKKARLMLSLRGIIRHAKVSLQGFAAQCQDPFVAEVLRLMLDAPGWPMPEVPLAAAVTLLACNHTRNMGTPLGGSVAVAQTVARRYRALGGELRCRARVTKILVEHGRAVGVRLADGTEHRADAVISAGDGRTALFDLLDGAYTTPELRRAYAEWKVYPPLIQVMLGVARDLSREPRHLIFDLPQPILIAGEARRQLEVLHYCHDASMAPAGRSVAQVWYASNHDYWATLHRDRAAYDAEKRRVAELSIAELERRWPGIAAQVEVVDVATPVTYARYTGNWQGSVDGWCITPRNLGVELQRMLPGLARFYMAGQWTTPFSGVPGAILSGSHVVQLLCKEDRRPFIRPAPPPPDEPPVAVELQEEELAG